MVGVGELSPEVEKSKHPQKNTAGAWCISGREGIEMGVFSVKGDG